MMKKMKKFSILAAVILVLSICLASCGASDPLEGDAAVGTWTMTGAEYSGMTLDADDLSGAMDEMPVFEISADGSATFSFNGSDGTGTVTKNDDGTYTLSDDSDETLDFEIKSDKLRLDYEDMNMIMIFEQK